MERESERDSQTDRQTDSFIELARQLGREMRVRTALGCWKKRASGGAACTAGEPASTMQRERPGRTSLREKKKKKRGNSRRRLAMHDWTEWVYRQMSGDELACLRGERRKKKNCGRGTGPDCPNNEKHLSLYLSLHWDTTTSSFSFLFFPHSFVFPHLLLLLTAGGKSIGNSQELFIAFLLKKERKNEERPPD